MIDTYKKYNSILERDEMGPPLESTVKMNIFRDTRDGKLLWESINKANTWFRAHIKLEKPDGAYLRFDAVKPFDDWAINIYYHRKDKDGILDLNGALVKKIEGGNVFSMIKQIKKKLNINDNSVFLDNKEVFEGDDVFYSGPKMNVMGLRHNRRYQIYRIDGENVTLSVFTDKIVIRKAWFKNNFLNGENRSSEVV